MATVINRKWYDDPNIQISVEYRRKFALFPVTINNEIIFFKYYYKKYLMISHRYDVHDYDIHEKYIEIITETEFSYRKLAGTLDNYELE